MIGSNFAADKDGKIVAKKVINNEKQEIINRRHNKREKYNREMNNVKIQINNLENSGVTVGIMCTDYGRFVMKNGYEDIPRKYLTMAWKV